MKFPYEDIVNLPHFHAAGRGFMSSSDRAAQFMPFKSLNEYEDYVLKKSDDVNNFDDPDYTILYE